MSFYLRRFCRFSSGWVTDASGGNKEGNHKIHLLFDDFYLEKSPDYMLTPILTVMCGSWLCTTHNSSFMSHFHWQWTAFIYSVWDNIFSCEKYLKFRKNILKINKHKCNNGRDGYLTPLIQHQKNINHQKHDGWGTILLHFTKETLRKMSESFPPQQLISRNHFAHPSLCVLIRSVQGQHHQLLCLMAN